MIDVSLDVDDLYADSDPVVVRARPERDPAGELVAIAVDVETNEERARQPLVPRDGGWYEAELGPLPEAVYRVTAFGAGSVEPVSDLVSVLAD
jgi:hypothetical protein